MNVCKLLALSICAGLLLCACAPASPPSSGPPASSRVAVIGCENLPPGWRDRLRVVQRLLNEQGYDPGRADGYMGRKTMEALKRFQANNGLPRTGKIDEATLTAMGFCDESMDGKPAPAPMSPHL